MFRNYIKIAIRNFWKHKLNSLINLVGLSLGLTACILITMYVSHEKSYDKFHDDIDRIYSLNSRFEMGGDSIGASRFNAEVAGMLKENNPNVEQASRIYKISDPVTLKTESSSSESFNDKGILAVDNNFFDFFSFNLLNGNPKNVLSNAFSTVLTQESAKKYFGDANPIGKQLIYEQDSTYTFTITGVLKDFPTNSSIKTNMLISMESLPVMKETAQLFEYKLFQNGSFATYLKLNEARKKYDIARTANTLASANTEENKTRYFLDAFSESYASNKVEGRIDYLNVFPIVALLILVLALTNYISLTTARAGIRNKEVGVRKISGASRKGIAFQFYIESALFVFVSFIVGIGISFITKNSFLQLLDISIDNSFFLNPIFMVSLFALLCFAILSSGIYPALVLSSFKPVDNFRSKVHKSLGSVFMRKAFTTFQFTIAVCLIVCGVVMSTQLDFMRNKNTGLDRSNVVMISIDKTMQNNLGAFRNNVNALSGVKNSSIVRTALYEGYSMFFASNVDQSGSFPLVTYEVDENFIKALGVTWLHEPESNTTFIDKGKIIINEKAITEFGLKPDPRGQKLAIGSQQIEIAGVVKDFNYASLEDPIKALSFFVRSEGVTNRFIEYYGRATLYLKYEDNVEAFNLLDQVESEYASLDKGTPFTYEFMDDTFDALYKEEIRLSYLFYVFIILALIIAGLGLLGLVTFASQQRTKEVGIRKVLGASVSEIVVLLSKDFIILVVLAIVIAFPLAWLIADDWLSYFTYQIDIPWWSFAIGASVALFISVFTLSTQGIKTALSNPSDALRTE